MKLETILYQRPDFFSKNIDRVIEYEGKKIELIHRFGHEGFQDLPIELLAVVDKFTKQFSDGYRGFHPRGEKWIVQKWKDPDGIIYNLQKRGYSLYDIIRKTGQVPYEIHVGHAIYPLVKINGMLNEGLDEIWDKVDGTDTGNLYNNANARVGVGNGTTAFNATHTGLQGGSTAFAAMDASFPTSTTQRINLKGSFPTGQAEFAWEEGTADNGVTPNNNLHRLVQAKGTKPVGETWTSESQITGS